MDIGADKAAGLAHQGAHVHVVPLFDNRLAGCADVLAHGQNDLRGQRHLFRGDAGSVLVVGQVDASRSAKPREQ